MDKKGINLRAVNIGETVTRRLKELNMTQVTFSKRMDMNPSNVNKFLRKSSVNSKKLLELSVVLRYNFFCDFIDVPSDDQNLPSPFEYKDDNFSIRYVEIGKYIAKYMRISGITQNELVTKLRTIKECSKIRQADISAIVNSEHIDTAKLYYISLVLNHNFFIYYCEDIEVENYGVISNTSQPNTNQHDKSTSELVRRIEELAIENERLKNEIMQLRKENEELKGVVK